MVILILEKSLFFCAPEAIEDSLAAGLVLLIVVLGCYLLVCALQHFQLVCDFKGLNHFPYGLFDSILDKEHAVFGLQVFDLFGGVVDDLVKARVQRLEQS